MKRILLIIAAIAPLMAMELPAPKPTGTALEANVLLEQALRTNDMKALLAAGKQGADARKRLDNGETMLHLAVKTDNARIVKRLFSWGAFLDINAEDNTGQSPTTLAYVRAIPEVIKLLEDAAQQKQELDETFKRIYGPKKPIKIEYIIKAIKDKDLQKVAMMLERAPQLLNVQVTKAGATLLHHAARLSKLEAQIALYLLNRGANPNIPNFKLQVPLHLAAWRDTPLITGFLLAFTADPNVQNDLGNTPLHDAAFKGYKEMVQLLVQNHADQNIRNNKGQTPLDLAKEQGNSEVVAIFQYLEQPPPKQEPVEVDVDVERAPTAPVLNEG